MFCTKCGKENHKKGKGWAVILLVLAFMLSGYQNTGSSAAVSQQEQPSQVQPQVQEQPPAEPEKGDVLENSTYANGVLRRDVQESYGTVYVYDYRSDGTMLRETWLQEDGDVKRVINCDAHGNPTDETETQMGELWLSMYYKNSYDEQGRPLSIAQYNRAGFPLYIRTYSYNADGSYRMDFVEYRGPVYEYDFDYSPEGTTTLAFEGYTTFSADGSVIDQMINEVGF